MNLSVGWPAQGQPGVSPHPYLRIVEKRGRGAVHITQVWYSRDIACGWDHFTVNRSIKFSE